MYTFKFQSLAPSTLSAQSLTSAADVLTYHVASQCQLVRAMAKVTTAVVSSGAVVVQVVRRPVNGSATGESVLATITIPAGTAQGKVVYKDVAAGTGVEAGNELIFRVSTAAAGGGAAGAMLGLVEAIEDPEVPLNQTNMLASV